MRETIKKLERLSGGKKVALWGKGASAAAAEKLFAKAGISCEYYGDGEREFDLPSAKSHRLAVYSPAFQNSHRFFKTAREANVAALGEPDIAGACWNGKIVAITGTNGKTTVTWIHAEFLRAGGFRTGYITTDETDTLSRKIYTGYTTPPLAQLKEIFAEMEANGATDCVMEVSSHAIHQRRTGDTIFAGGGFTNI